MDNAEAARFVDKKRYDSIKNKKDFTFETVLSSAYKIEILEEAKRNGYFIKCIFILTTDSTVNLARVSARVASGGHDVPKDTIIQRYNKSLANIKKLVDICDILHVYDNTGDEPVRIIRKHKDDVSIYPNELWDEERILKLILG